MEFKEGCCNSTELKVLDLSPFRNLQYVRIEKNTLQTIASIIFAGCNRLKSVIIDTNSLNKVNSFTIPNPSIIQWNRVVYSIPELLNCHPYITNLTIPNDSCNEANYTSIYLQSFEYLKELFIGTRSLTNLKTISISGLQYLAYFTVDEYSLTSLTTFEAANLNPSCSFDIHSSSMNVVYRDVYVQNEDTNM